MKALFFFLKMPYEGMLAEASKKGFLERLE